MHSDQAPYRALYDDIYDYEGTALYDDLVKPWLRANESERTWLDEMARRRGEPVPVVTIEESWRLYALSRIVNLLQIGLEPALAPGAKNHGPTIEPVSREEYAAFMEALGLSRIERSALHPFFHEVVTVEQLVEPAAAARITQEYWPGYTLGPLLITRAGCTVAAGSGVMRKDLAEQSTLYWMRTRRNRPTEDQSHGWGSNSQWRTEFRLDYLLDGRLHYNAGARKLGKVAGREMEDDLTSAEKLELLRFRCFVQCTKRDGDRWPYALSHREEA
jgi:hypothetical protein